MTIIPHDLVLEAALECLVEASDESRDKALAKPMALSRIPKVAVAQSWI